MGRHKEPPAVWPLPRRKDIPHEKIPHNPGNRLIATGSSRTVTCFGCGAMPCTCE